MDMTHRKTSSPTGEKRYSVPHDGLTSSSMGLARGGLNAPPLPAVGSTSPYGTGAAAANGDRHRSPAHQLAAAREGYRSALVSIMQHTEGRPRSRELPPIDRRGSPPGEGDDAALASTLLSKDQEAPRYNFYINNGIDTEHIAPMDEAWLEHMLGLLSDDLRRGTQATVDRLCDETREDYTMSVKRAIIDFVLHDGRGAGGPIADYVHMPGELKQVPLPWAISCAQHRSLLERTLFLCSSPLRTALSLWMSSYASQRLVRVPEIVSRAGAVELNVFCKLVSSHCESVQTILQKVFTYDCVCVCVCVCVFGDILVR